MFKILKNEFFYLAIILLLGFLVRLYRINSPIADWHSWRQADTAAVTRNFIKEGFNPSIPKDDDMSGISDPPIVNINRFRFVEFPIYNIAVYPLYLFLGVNDMYSRLVSALFSLGVVVFLYFICKKYLGKVEGLIAAAIYTFLPFNVFFSRTTLPEPTFLFFSLGMIYFVDCWIWQNKYKWMILGGVFTAIAFLAKPWAIFFTPPIIYSLILKYKFRIPFKYYLVAFLSLLPFLFWRLWIMQQPEGIPASNWLLNGDHIRFRPSFWWWLVSERLGREILGATGFVLFCIGMIFRPKNNNYFLHVWLLSIFSYFAIIATGNVRHNYYQYITVPILAVFLSIGFTNLIKGIPQFLPRIFGIIFAVFLLSLAYFFSWNLVKEFYKVNNPAIVEAGKKADQILPKNAVVVAPYNGDTAFLYQTNRPGFPFVPLPLPEMVADYGVTTYISTTKDNQTNWVLRHFKVLENNSDFVIADLTKITKPYTGDPQP